MSLAKQLIGEPAPKAESRTPAQETAPVNAKTLIDTLAAQEYGLPESSLKGAKSSGSKKKAVAKAPGSVSYGKK